MSEESFTGGWFEVPHPEAALELDQVPWKPNDADPPARTPATVAAQAERLAPVRTMTTTASPTIGVGVTQARATPQPDVDEDWLPLPVERVLPPPSDAIPEFEEEDLPAVPVSEIPQLPDQPMPTAEEQTA